MKKTLLIILIVAALTLISCSGPCADGHVDADGDMLCDVCEAKFSGETPADPETPDTPDEPDEPDEPVCEHSYVEIEKIEPLVLKDGATVYKCSLCEGTYSEPIPMTKSLKVLAIGNSFSVDAVTYLWDICKSAGVTNLVIGNAQIGGCSIDMHFSYMVNKNATYQYTKYTKKGTEVKENVRADVALLDEDWDVIITQQLSQYAGKPSSFGYFDNLIEYISKKCPDAEIYWHMTWAYQEGITKSGYEYYNNDQMTMYNAIVETVNSTVLARPAIKGVIPAGTAMQNLRTSSIGDNVTRDGYHAALDVGRMTISLTWYATLTGGSLDLVDWMPSGSNGIAVKNNYSLILEAVGNAIEKPYEVTQSKNK